GGAGTSPGPVRVRQGGERAAQREARAGAAVRSGRGGDVKRAAARRAVLAAPPALRGGLLVTRRGRRGRRRLAAIFLVRLRLVRRILLALVRLVALVGLLRVGRLLVVRLVRGRVDRDGADARHGGAAAARHAAGAEAGLDHDAAGLPRAAPLHAGAA